MKMQWALSLLVASHLALANETLWTEAFQAYGSGKTTKSASAQAYENAKPEVAAHKETCNDQRGELSVRVEYGYCTVNHDPLFCLNGCYTCPVYGTATCYIETNGEFKPGALVEVTVDSAMLTGTTQVGKVSKGDRYTIVQLKGTWIALATTGGTSIPGWIQKTKLKIATPESQ